jgi:hypothetical protein
MASLPHFQEMLRRVPEGKKPHVLLGNGFSRACKNDIFSYDALFDRADFKTLSPAAKEAFRVLGTTDFEVVMKVLRDASKVIRLYEKADSGLSAQLKKDADGLKDVLVAAIGANHPDMPNAIDDKAYSACRQFISTFSNVYSLNYDLLLYWALMHDELRPYIECDDGFRSPEDRAADYVTWEPENTVGQNIFYLHGALHIFDADTEIQKYTWNRTGIRLIEQIRAALEQDRFPLFVAEGTARQKLTRIMHRDYLSRSYRSFLAIGGTLFVYGVSLGPSDNHILRAIELPSSRIANVFVAIYGDPTTTSNQALIARAKALGAKRRRGNPLTVDFFDASTAQVWG